MLNVCYEVSLDKADDGCLIDMWSNSNILPDELQTYKNTCNPNLQYKIKIL